MAKSSELFKPFYLHFLDYVAHEITKEFLKNSHFENMTAGFLRRCQNSLRQISPKKYLFQLILCHNYWSN